MVGRRWSDGLHQATEAKENVPIKAENQTLATITLQNYFRLYQKLAGMTGTADTEAYEFQSIYGLEVVVVPTNKPIIRKDFGDKIYISTRSKYKAIVDDILQRVKTGQPILVGTASIESSEYLSQKLTEAKIPHQVLNAKYHEKEAKIIAQAGKAGAVTIATNMAGRGTDIILGGNLKAEINEFDNPSEAEIARLTKIWEENQRKVLNAGGLHVLGTERNEARRIDNQLRGRSGRQGDPGSSQYYLSMEDNLMRLFAPERMTMLMRKLGLKEDEVIENALVTRAIENAQRKVEGHNFDIRKQLLEYDDVANDQRKVIYQQRAELMEAADLSDIIREISGLVINKFIDQFIPPQSIEEQWNVSGLEKALAEEFRLHLPLTQWLAEDAQLYEENLREKIIQAAVAEMQAKEQQIGAENMRRLERNLLLQVLDHQWKEHLAQMDYLRKGIHLRGYAQKNPKQEYKREAFEMFSRMLDEIKFDVIKTLVSMQIQSPESLETMAVQQAPKPSNVHYIHQSMNIMQGQSAEGDDNAAENEKAQPFTRELPKVGRNEPCPCGSGKKFKHCHGQLS
jgi:preprotein translocase subunit SecA